MNRKYLLLLSLLFCSFISYSSLKAQSGPNLWLGVHGGIDIGTVSSDPSPDNGITLGSRTGIEAGLQADLRVSDMFGLEGQLSFVQKGATESSSFGVSPLSEKLNFSYFQIPVLLRAKFGDGALKPYVFLGPEVGFKLAATITLTEGGRDTTFDIADSEFTPINLSIVAGAGLLFDITESTAFFLDAAYDYGLTNLNAHYGKSDGSSSTDNQKIYTRDFRFRVGILLGMGN
ncbi:MAG: porin family protein [Ignavibacteriota bacterium]